MLLNPTCSHVRDAFKIKKNGFKDIVPIRPDTPPSIATLGHQHLGHLCLALDPIQPIKIWDILEYFG